MSARENEIKREIERLQGELEGLSPMERMGVREFARAAGISPTTAGRIKHGKTDKLDMRTAKKALPFLHKCPLCNSTLTEGGSDG